VIDNRPQDMDARGLMPGRTVFLICNTVIDVLADLNLLLRFAAAPTWLLLRPMGRER
jgi:hypothetical protein